MKTFVGLIALCALASSASAQITNGSFEAGTAPGSFITLNSGSTAITGWTVFQGSIDYIGTYWTAADGVRSIDLAGTNAAGGIQQAINTILAQEYLVTFQLAGNPAGSPTTKVLVAAAGNETATFSFDVTGATLANMNWTTHSFSFIADATTTLLQFSARDAGSFGPALDNVSIQAIPEPSTYAALLGLAVLGFVGYRRFRRSR